MAKPIETRYCENCNKPVSRERQTCQNCGTKLSRNMGKTGCVLIALVVGIGVIAAISIFKYISQSDFDPQDPSAGEGQSQSRITQVHTAKRV
ncbi:MAG: hypothetical protein CMP08_00250 [Xanthomonadales bacterium]|nr:hypothetical protein [Xanthomonadales bacterium]|tara:strand:- start:295 stop:570 length:276 start_codon:yes stop_codon:yes gene_type:complete